ncbi:hypothetical protein HYE82_34695 [Streptomyces sp. BR123]|uniref:hypothetical protein n=1 Tax=Streptomyces sp. BR123 TaxID=2749828 RepID=UPI0015C47407|nr:hypothetical protein [Streptomyces sp. BR123]NXY99433.1 hypothetical protein [Streptomyces sp. BR123]
MSPSIRTITFDRTGDPYDLGLFRSRVRGRPPPGRRPRFPERPFEPPAFAHDAAGTR